MTKLQKIFLVISILSLSHFSFAQQLKNAKSEIQYRAVHWNVEEGLAQDEVYCMIKDINGFLWIGTRFGLSRFDGKNFKNYFASGHNDNKSVIGNEINGLIEDSLHNIWIGTEKGLSRYDIKADTFSHFISSDPSRSATVFWATPKEIFFWDHPHRISAYNIHTFSKRTLVEKIDMDTVSYGVSDFYTIYDESSNCLWIEKGIPAWGHGGKYGGLLKISLPSGKREDFPWNCFRNIPKHDHFTEGMRLDRKRNAIWINSQDGLLEFTLADKQFHQINTLNDLVNNPSYHGWAGIDIDRNGQIWLGTDPKGTIIYNPDNNIYRLVFPDDSIQQNIISSANVSLYCDKNGMTWSGYWDRKGLYQIMPYSKSITRFYANPTDQDSLGDNKVYTCINANEGKVWIGTSNGFNIFNPVSGKFQQFHQKDLPGLKGDNILPIAIDSIAQKAVLNIFDQGLLYKMDIKTRKCTAIIFKDSANHTIQDFNFIVPRKYGNGCIIAVFRSENILDFFMLNRESLVARQVLSFSRAQIEHFSLPDENNLLFFNRPKPLRNLTYIDQNGKWSIINTPLDSIEWKQIRYSPGSHTYWVVTGDRIIHYNRQFQIISEYNSENGMPGNEIHNCIEDDDGNFWFNTDRFIYQLNTKAGQIRILSESDGFQKQNFTGTPTPIIKDIYGCLYFPCGRVWGSGFDRIDPRQYSTIPPASVYLQSILINQKELKSSSGVNNINEISLRYFENNFVIETGNLDFYSNGQGRIRYKLETEDKPANWQYAPVYSNLIFPGLQPGNYKLVMQASTIANEFNGPEKILFIHISPAFWNTWWFRVAIVLLIAAIFYGVLRWRLQQKFHLQMERSEKEMQLAEMRQKTAELEMQALRAQMNPHFIFNSLNSINRFILQNERVQASEYLTKFSRLVRLILQNSQVALIPLESELESLELYLELEALRFDHRFEYKISVPKDLDIEMIKVPPLIVQPYAENAIWHGLMHKEEKGKLDIEVSLEGHQLFFIITDNGIGRKKSAELTNKTPTKHKSVGLQITADRIAMMQSMNGKESPVIINDLVNPDGSAAGTEVVLRIQVQQT